MITIKVTRFRTLIKPWKSKIEEFLSPRDFIDF